MAVVDWSKLPTELLNLISQQIDNEVDLIRFQSICSTWRASSVPNHHHILPFKFPLLQTPFFSHQIETLINSDLPFGYLSKHNFFLIKPPQQQQQQTLLRPWLIRVCQNTRGQTQLFHPLFHHYPLPRIRLVLDFNKLSVLHLGSNNFIQDRDIKTDNGKYRFPIKVVAVTCHGKKPLVAVAPAFPPQPLLLKCGDGKWKVILDMSTGFGDICLFKGRPYVVDKIGKTVMVGPDSSVHLVAEPLVGRGNKKFLAESKGDLLLADVYDPDLNDSVRIDLFKLNEKEKKWVKLTSLGDRVLFLGELCSFSASASDLCVAKGNCVIFCYNIICSSKSESCILDLDQGRHSPLSDYPEYSNLFWPPPKWI